MDVVKRQQSEENEQLRKLKVTCMDNLLAAPELRVYFKDLESRFLLISAGCDATVPSGHALEEFIGKTDHSLFSQEHAAETFKDEQDIIRSGKPMEEKLQRETFLGRADAWVSTSKMPLRNEQGEII